MTTTAPPANADRRFGYRFGCNGVVSLAKAAELLDCSERTVERRVAEGFLRLGYAKPGSPKSGARICRRSLDDYIASLER